ncbi:uncharacterized protein LOC117195903 [Orcinus orca]|uniref:uncharacterized protein LOC117195903 n=1 Tax=Orcinus orca TaxID=9733 RepID=UPI0014425FED|nr:uncharacterized protein LOC117195903 [Orcinus orca]
MALLIAIGQGPLWSLSLPSPSRGRASSLQRQLSYILNLTLSKVLPGVPTCFAAFQSSCQTACLSACPPAPPPHSRDWAPVHPLLTPTLTLPCPPGPLHKVSRKTPRRLRHSREQPFRIRARPLHRPPRSAAPARFLGSPSPSHPPASRWLSASPEPRRRPGRRARARALSPGAQPSDLLLSTPVSERLPLIWDRRPLCAWRVLHPRTSVPKERTCTKPCGPASREAPSCTPGPATHPTPALRLPGGALVPPSSGWGEPGRARTFGGRGDGQVGGAHGRAGCADGCSTARTQVRSGSSRFLRPPPALWEASGLGSDFGAEAGSLSASALLFPLLAEGQVGRSGKSGPRPRKAGGAGTRVS